MPFAKTVQQAPAQIGDPQCVIFQQDNLRLSRPCSPLGDPRQCLQASHRDDHRKGQAHSRQVHPRVTPLVSRHHFRPLPWRTKCSVWKSSAWLRNAPKTPSLPLGTSRNRMVSMASTSTQSAMRRWRGMELLARALRSMLDLLICLVPVIQRRRFAIM